MKERLSDSRVKVVEQKNELRQHASSCYVTPVCFSSLGAIRLLVRFAKLLIVVIFWLSNMSLTER